MVPSDGLLSPCSAPRCRSKALFSESFSLLLSHYPGKMVTLAVQSVFTMETSWKGGHAAPRSSQVRLCIPSLRRWLWSSFPAPWHGWVVPRPVGPWAAPRCARSWGALCPAHVVPGSAQAQRVLLGPTRAAEPSPAPGALQVLVSRTHRSPWWSSGAGQCGQGTGTGMLRSPRAGATCVPRVSPRGARHRLGDPGRDHSPCGGLCPGHG